MSPGETIVPGELISNMVTKNDISATLVQNRNRPFWTRPVLMSAN